MRDTHPPPIASLPSSRTGEAGFSLIEMIAALILLGVMAGGMGLGLTGMIKGYTTSRDAVTIGNKGQLALQRLSRELRVVSSVTSASATAITYVYQDETGTNKTHTLSKTSSNVTLNDGAGNNDILVDNVNALALAYYDRFDSAPQTTWNLNRRIIEVSLTLIGPNGTTIPFVIRLAPRNLF